MQKILSLLLPVFLLPAGLWAGTQATFYVAPDGGGTNFTADQPGELTAARDAIRAINTNMTGDIVVYLRGGVYPLTNGFTLEENATNHDSGTGGYAIIYMAYPGETPVFSGGITVTNWALYNAATNIWRAYVGTNVNSRQLYVNGVRAIRARGPVDPSGFTRTATGFTTTSAMQSWINPTNIEIVQRQTWKQLRCSVASISGQNIVMQTPGWTFTGTSPTPGPPWNGGGTVSFTGVSWVENAFELLNGAGMWYLNRATGYLYYIPRPGENLATAEVVLPVAEMLVDARGGSLTTPLHDVVFSGITFEYATWLLPSTSAGYADNQTGVMWAGPTTPRKTLGNLSLQTARDIQITNNIFQHLGGAAVDLGGGAHDNLIAGNRITDISAGGIALGEVTDFATTDTNRMTDGNVIANNFIRQVGQEYEDAIPIWVGYARNTLIAHNDLDNVPYSGICVGWGWGTYSYAANNQIIGNRVGKVMQVLHDGGSFYSLSAQTNSWEIGNYYHDSCAHGIYWDEGTAYYTAASNVVADCDGNWVNIWTSSIHHDTATNNFSNVNRVSNNGTACAVAATTYVNGQNWPPAAVAIIQNAGLEPAYAGIRPREILLNDTEMTFDHVPANWGYSGGRSLGDYHSDVHYTDANGDYVQYTFAGTGIAWIGEMNSDEGNVAVWLDGGLKTTVNCASPTRIAQARLYAVSNLAPGRHTLKLVKSSGSYLILDAFAITPLDFTLTPLPATPTVTLGGTADLAVLLDTLIGFTNPVTLSVSGLPAGVSASFDPPTLTGVAATTLHLTAAATAAAGNYPLTITGGSSTLTNSASASLTVKPTWVYGCSPVALTAGSYNVDVVVEKNAAHVSTATTATVDAEGNTWFERGYYPGDATAGLPSAGARFTSATQADHSYQLAASYTAPNAIYLDAGTHSSVTLVPVNPAAYSVLSFLGSSGNDNMNLNYVVHHANGQTDSGSFTVPDWFHDGAVALGVGGRVNTHDGSFGIQGGGSQPNLFSVDVALGGSTSPVTSITLTRSSGNGQACILAMSAVYANQPHAFTGVTPNPDGSQSLAFAGLPGYDYILRYATNLTPPVAWQNVATNRADATGQWQFTATNVSASAAGFYQTVYQP